MRPARNRIWYSKFSGLPEKFPLVATLIVIPSGFSSTYGLVGTLSMARTMKDRDKALQILAAGRQFLTESFLRRPAGVR
jgi:hypothetical protein